MPTALGVAAAVEALLAAAPVTVQVGFGDGF
jgi:hypothetical protein